MVLEKLEDKTMKTFIALFSLLLIASCAATIDFEDAETAFNRKDYFTAIKKYEISSEQGNSMATLKIGTMHDGGLGIVQNHKEALRYYKLAARQGHPLGYVFVGAMYENGQGVPKNPSEAQRWKNLAALCISRDMKNCENLDLNFHFNK